MTRPTIIFVRHGESTANINRSDYAKYQEHNVPLTELGYQQSVNVGNSIKSFLEKNPDLKDKKIRIYYSPFLRTKQTMDGIVKGASGTLDSAQKRESALLREKEFGAFVDFPTKEKVTKHYPIEMARLNDLTKKNGSFYARSPNGESLADLATRAEIFKDQMMSALERNDIGLCIVVSHSQTLKALEHAFFHHDVTHTQNEPIMQPGEAKILEPLSQKGYKTSTIENITRNKHLPPQYKANAYNETVQSVSVS